MNTETSNANNLDLKDFVNHLIEEKKLPEGLEQEVVDQIKADLLSQVEDRVNMTMISNLSQEKLEEFNKMLDDNASDEDLQKFFSSSIPNLTQIITAELIVFKQTYLLK